MTPVALQAKRFFTCPECNQGEYFVEHLIEDAYKKRHTIKAGPWFCTLCGYGFTLQVDIAHGNPSRAVVQTEPHTKRQYKEWVVVDIPPQAEPIRLVCEHIRSEPTITEGHIRLTRFRYEENTSLVNVFHETEEIRDSLRINPKLIQVCATKEEAEQVCYDHDPR